MVDGREVGVEPICAKLKEAGVQIAPSSYYASKTRPPSARAVCDAELVTDIKVAHKANLGVYGARKIHAELNREGVKVARCTVERLMRAEGLRGIPREKSRKTTIGDGAETERPEDLVKRSFAATGPNQLWVAELQCRRRHLQIADPLGVGPLGGEVPLDQVGELRGGLVLLGQPVLRLIRRAIRPWRRIESATVFSLTSQPSSRRSACRTGRAVQAALLGEHHPHGPVDGVAPPVPVGVQTA